LTDGAIVAIKNTSGYLLCCNAEDRVAVGQLRKRKSRPQKPFAVLYPSVEKLQTEIGLTRDQIDLLSSRERPITILPLSSYHGKIALDLVAPELNQLGVMLPYSGILQLLANELSFPIVATSGNIHRSPIISGREEAVERLDQVADYFLQHNLRILHPQDDSVLKFSKKFDIPVFFRRSRGYAPNYLDDLPKSKEVLMAMGSQLKSTIAYYPNNYLYISEYLGDLENYNVYERFTHTVHSFISIFEKQPEVVLVDKHPGYNSTRYGRELAEKNNSKVFEIQHHKAHLAAILAEHQLFDSTVLGVIFDGTGYGDDGQVWGGEFFNYCDKTIERIEHFQYFDWLLGDKMSMEPRLSLLSLADDMMEAYLVKKFSASEIKTYNSILKSHTLKTSSVGRLFDAVASLIGICDYNTYEGEAAILLENFIDTYDASTCRNYHEIIDKGISARLIIKEMYQDLLAGVSQKQLAANFLFTLASIIIKMAEKYEAENVVLSGGVFQNTTLVDMLFELAPKEIKLYFHKNLSPNDENIAFGQIAYYLNINDQQ
ncbi:MAG: carbamoyltransferase HypF, partial [Flavobacteriaceae bacterium]|nr:carbamoyltransferase HypF [Flavobacteriaceae bacterium]